MSALVIVVGTTGRVSLNLLYAMARVCVLTVDTLHWSLVAPLTGKGLRVRSTTRHFVEFGAHSLPVVGLVCFLIGAI
ncbi:MAG: hypothetical protein GY851_36810, partial [bacterium]|nr:hypothetical protein [bacterium]